MAYEGSSLVALGDSTDFDDSRNQYHLSPMEQREPLGPAMMLPQAADRDEWFVPASRWRFQNAQADPDSRDRVRDGNALYANLTLASADTSPTATEQSKTTAETPPVTNAGSPARSRRRQHHWAASRLSPYHFGYRYFGGGC